MLNSLQTSKSQTLNSNVPFYVYNNNILAVSFKFINWEKAYVLQWVTNDVTVVNEFKTSSPWKQIKIFVWRLSHSGLDEGEIAARNGRANLPEMLCEFAEFLEKQRHETFANHCCTRLPSGVEWFISFQCIRCRTLYFAYLFAFGSCISFYKWSNCFFGFELLILS